MSTTHFANPDETTFTGATFTFSFGAYGDTKVVVLHRAGHCGDALEIAAEWLAENASGLFAEPDYQNARAERGCTDPDCTTPTLNGGCLCEACSAHAETDLTYTESGWIASWEWTVDESEGEPFETPRFDRFDICQAHAAYWSAWHQGQFSDGYRDLCRATALVAGVKSFDSLTENGQAIYRQLVIADGR